jgi:hypothetical protein
MMMLLFIERILLIIIKGKQYAWNAEVTAIPRYIQNRKFWLLPKNTMKKVLDTFSILPISNVKFMMCGKTYCYNIHVLETITNH